MEEVVQSFLTLSKLQFRPITTGSESYTSILLDPAAQLTLAVNRFSEEQNYSSKGEPVCHDGCERVSVAQRCLTCRTDLFCSTCFNHHEHEHHIVESFPMTIPACTCSGCPRCTHPCAGFLQSKPSRTVSALAQGILTVVHVVTKVQTMYLQGAGFQGADGMDPADCAAAGAVVSAYIKFAESLGDGVLVRRIIAGLLLLDEAGVADVANGAGEKVGKSNLLSRIIGKSNPSKQLLIYALNNCRQLVEKGAEAILIGANFDLKQSLFATLYEFCKTSTLSTLDNDFMPKHDSPRYANWLVSASSQCSSIIGIKHLLGVGLGKLQLLHSEFVDIALSKLFEGVIPLKDYGPVVPAVSLMESNIFYRLIQQVGCHRGSAIAEIDDILDAKPSSELVKAYSELRNQLSTYTDDTAVLSTFNSMNFPKTWSDSLGYFAGTVSHGRVLAHIVSAKFAIQLNYITLMRFKSSQQHSETKPATQHTVFPLSPAFVTYVSAACNCPPVVAGLFCEMVARTTINLDLLCEEGLHATMKYRGVPLQRFILGAAGCSRIGAIKRVRLDETPSENADTSMFRFFLIDLETNFQRAWKSLTVDDRFAVRGLAFAAIQEFGRAYSPNSAWVNGPAPLADCQWQRSQGLHALVKFIIIHDVLAGEFTASDDQVATLAGMLVNDLAFIAQVNAGAWGRTHIRVTPETSLPHHGEALALALLRRATPYAPVWNGFDEKLAEAFGCSQLMAGQHLVLDLDDNRASQSHDIVTFLMRLLLLLGDARIESLTIHEVMEEIALCTLASNSVALASKPALPITEFYLGHYLAALEANSTTVALPGEPERALSLVPDAASRLDPFATFAMDSVDLIVGRWDHARWSTGRCLQSHGHVSDTTMRIALSVLANSASQRENGYPNTAVGIAAQIILRRLNEERQNPVEPPNPSVLLPEVQQVTHLFTTGKALLQLARPDGTVDTVDLRTVLTQNSDTLTTLPSLLCSALLRELAPRTAEPTQDGADAVRRRRKVRQHHGDRVQRLAVQRLTSQAEQFMQSNSSMMEADAEEEVKTSSGLDAGTCVYCSEAFQPHENPLMLCHLHGIPGKSPFAIPPQEREMRFQSTVEIPELMSYGNLVATGVSLVMQNARGHRLDMKYDADGNVKVDSEVDLHIFIDSPLTKFTTATTQPHSLCPVPVNDHTRGFRIIDSSEVGSGPYSRLNDIYPQTDSLTARVSYLTQGALQVAAPLLTADNVGETPTPQIYNVNNTVGARMMARCHDIRGCGPSTNLTSKFSRFMANPVITPFSPPVTPDKLTLEQVSDAVRALNATFKTNVYMHSVLQQNLGIEKDITYPVCQSDDGSVLPLVLPCGHCAHEKCVRQRVSRQSCGCPICNNHASGLLPLNISVWSPLVQPTVAGVPQIVRYSPFANVSRVIEMNTNFGQYSRIFVSSAAGLAGAAVAVSRAAAAALAADGGTSRTVLSHTAHELYVSGLCRGIVALVQMLAPRTLFASQAIKQSRSYMSKVQLEGDSVVLNAICEAIEDSMDAYTTFTDGAMLDAWLATNGELAVPLFAMLFCSRLYHEICNLSAQTRHSEVVGLSAVLGTAFSLVSLETCVPSSNDVFPDTDWMARHIDDINKVMVAVFESVDYVESQSVVEFETVNDWNDPRANDMLDLDVDSFFQTSVDFSSIEPIFHQLITNHNLPQLVSLPTLLSSSLESLPRAQRNVGAEISHLIRTAPDTCPCGTPIRRHLYCLHCRSVFCTSCYGIGADPETLHLNLRAAAVAMAASAAGGAPAPVPVANNTRTHPQIEAMMAHSACCGGDAGTAICFLDDGRVDLYAVCSTGVSLVSARAANTWDVESWTELKNAEIADAAGNVVTLPHIVSFNIGCIQGARVCPAELVKPSKTQFSDLETTFLSAVESPFQFQLDDKQS